jgi:diacylglycerol O-acyltransferase
LARAPSRLLDEAWRAARTVAINVMPLAPPSPLNGSLSPLRHLAMDARPIDDLKVIKRSFATTMNDILLAASAGALRALLRERDEWPCEIKAMVPVAVEAPDERWGNRIAFLFMRLPCAEADPLWRLREAHVAMRDRKREGEPKGSDAVLNAISYAPRPVRRLATRAISSPRLSNLTISNIPGPRTPLYLRGCEIRDGYPVVPLTDGHGLSIGMTTFNDRACFGVYAQAQLADDADRIARGIGEEIDELLARAQA